MLNVSYIKMCKLFGKRKVIFYALIFVFVSDSMTSNRGCILIFDIFDDLLEDTRQSIQLCD